MHHQFFKKSIKAPKSLKKWKNIKYLSILKIYQICEILEKKYARLTRNYKMVNSYKDSILGIIL